MSTGRQMSARRFAKGLISQAGETGRLVALLIADGAARVMPRAWALGLCDAVGWLMMLTPFGLRVVRRMERTFPDGDGKRIAHEWLTRSLRDHVVVTRIVLGWENPYETPIRSIGLPPRFGPDDPSLIIATGHFSREANMAFYDPNVMPHMISVVAPLDFEAWTPKGIRLRLQFGRIREAALRFRKDVKTEFIEVGAPNAMVRLAKRLRRPGQFAVLSADVPWTNAPRADRYERPFAGRARQSFALGAARLARLGQCPVVTCVPFLDRDGNLAIEWGPPIPPPARDDADGDARVIDAILGRLELAVGARPGQYVIAVGHGRTWSAAQGRWIGAEQTTEAPTTEIMPVAGARRRRGGRGWRARHGTAAVVPQATETPLR